MSNDLEKSIENVLRDGLAKSEFDALKQHGCFIDVDNSGKVKASWLTEEIVIKINSQESFEAQVFNEPTGIYFDIRDYGVDALDAADIIFDEDGYRYKRMY